MTHDHDTVVVDRGGSGMGAVLGILAIVILLAAIWFFALGPGAGTGTNEGGGESVPVPSAPAIDLPSVQP